MRALRLIWSLVVLAGCGRISFAQVDDAPTAETGNVLVNPSCEGSVDPWFGFNAAVTLGTPARSRATACLVCRSTGPVSSLDTMTGVNDIAAPATGTTWRVSAWVRLPVSAGAGTSARMSIREWVSGTVGPQMQGPTVSLSYTNWTLVEIPSYTVVSNDVQNLDFFIDIFGVVGDCMLVDDLFFGPA